jgi:hypothetical protein
MSLEDADIDVGLTEQRHEVGLDVLVVDENIVALCWHTYVLALRCFTSSVYQVR